MTGTQLITETICVEITKTGWYKEMKAKTSPGDVMRVYRENQQMTQAQLVSNMERGKRAISLATAKKLAVIFDVSVSRFFAL